MSVKSIAEWGRRFFGVGETFEPMPPDLPSKLDGYVLPKQLPEAALLDFGLPHFPVGIGLLQFWYDRGISDGVLQLESAASNVRGFPRVGVLENEETIGGYRWPVGYHFRLPNGQKATILFPPRHYRIGGSFWHCAVYVQGDVDNACMQVLEQLVAAFADAIRR